MSHVQEHVAQLNMILGQQTGWSPRLITNAKKNLVDNRSVALKSGILLNNCIETRCKS